MDAKRNDLKKDSLHSVIYTWAEVGSAQSKGTTLVKKRRQK